MKVEIKRVLIEAKIKHGFFVEHGGMFKCVKRITDTGNITFTDNTTSTEEESAGKIVKFIGVYKDRTYSIFHGDFANIVYTLDSVFNISEDGKDTKKTKRGYELLIEGVNIEMNGKIEKVLCKADKGMPVILTSIKIIDAHKLYEKSDRSGVITGEDNFNYTIKLNNSEKIATGKREDFELVGTKNEIFMIHITCPYCNR